MIGNSFLANCEVVPYPPKAENSAGRFVFSSSQRDLGSDFTPLRGNDRLLLIHGGLKSKKTCCGNWLIQ